MLRTSAAVALTTALVPGLARADVAEANMTLTADPKTINIADCDVDRSVSVTGTVAAFSNDVADTDNWYLEMGGGCPSPEQPPEHADCTPATVSTCCQRIKDGASSSLGGSGTFDLRDVTDCAVGQDASIPLRFRVFSQSANFESRPSMKQLTYVIDLSRPDRPGPPEMVAGESTATGTWEASEGVGYKLCVFTGPFDAERTILDQAGDLASLDCSTRREAGDATLDDLQGSVTFNAVVVAFDDAGNESLPSTAAEFSTQDVSDFYELYRREAGGGDPGGYCAAAGPGAAGGPGGAWLFAGVAACGLSLRRRRRMVGAVAAIAAAAVFAPGAARAESPRFMTVAFRVGDWLPNVDDEFPDAARAGLAGPYERAFGTSAATVVGLDFGAHIVQEAGTLSLDLGLGVGSVNGKGVGADGGPSSEATTLTLWPLSLSVGYAMDLPAERWGFPVVPYAKVGVDWVLWAVEDGSGETPVTESPDGEGAGATWGWHWSAGGRLLLDALAPDMARTFDLDMGVNNSYLFVEWLDATVDDFGDRDALHLGGETVFWGLAFDF